MTSTISLDTSVYKVGPASLKVTGIGTTAPEATYVVTGLTIGKTYALSGFARQDPGDAGSRQAIVNVVGTSGAQYFTLYGSKGSWYKSDPQPFEFVATATSHTIQLLGLSGTSYSLWFDAITLTDAGQVIWTVASGNVSGSRTALPSPAVLLVKNSGFENPSLSVGWSGSINAGITIVNPMAGSYVGQISYSGTGLAQLLSDEFPVFPGGLIIAHNVQMRLSSGTLSGQARCGIRFYNSSHTLILSSTGNPHTPTGTQSGVGSEEAVPANAAYGRYAYYLDSTEGGGGTACTIDIDTVKVAYGSWSGLSESWITPAATGSVTVVHYGSASLIVDPTTDIPVALPYGPYGWMQSGSNSSTSASVTIPNQSVLVGAMHVIALTRQSSVTGALTATPSGYTSLYSYDGGSIEPSLDIWYKILTAGDLNTSRSAQWTTLAPNAMVSATFLDYHPSDPWATINVDGTGPNSALQVPNVSTPTAYSMLLALASGLEAAAASGGPTIGDWSGVYTAMNTQASTSTTAKDAILKSGYASMGASPSQTFAQTASSSTSVYWRGYVVGLRPTRRILPITSSFVTEFATAVSSNAANISLNPSFEAGLSSYNTAQSSMVQSTDYAYAGRYSSKTTMSSTTDSNFVYYNQQTLTGTGQWTMSAYFYIPAGSPLAGRTVYISPESGSGYTNDGGTTPTLVAGQWVRAERWITASTTVGTVMVARLNGDLPSAVGQIIYSDAWMLENNARATSFFAPIITPAATAAVTKSSTAAYTLSTTAMTEAAAGFVTDTATAAHTVPITVAATIPAIVDTATATLTATITPVTTPAAMTKTATAAVTVSPAVATALSGITRNGQASFTVSTTGITEVTSGFVTDFGTASYTLDTIEASAGFVTDTATAATTVAYTVAAAAGAVTKPATLTLTATITPVTTGLVTDYGTASRTVTITPASSANVWASYFWQPDALLVQTGLSGVVANIQDSPTAPDGNALTPSGGAINLRMSFENPGSQLRKQSGDQIIRVRVTAV